MKILNSKHIKFILGTAFAFAFAMMQGACTTYTATEIENKKPSYLDKIQVADGLFISDLNVRSAKKSNGFLKINISGTATFTQTIYYKVRWFDKDGMLIETRQSAWIERNMISGVPFIFTAVSPNNKAEDFSVIITDDIGGGKLEPSSITNLKD